MHLPTAKIASILRPLVYVSLVIGRNRKTQSQNMSTKVVRSPEDKDKFNSNHYILNSTDKLEDDYILVRIFIFYFICFTFYSCFGWTENILLIFYVFVDGVFCVCWYFILANR